MSFFKKLFGKKETKSQSESQTFKEPEISIKVEVVSRETAEPDINETMIEKIQKDYDISEIKKQSTQVKNKKGLLASIDFIRDFISSKDIEFKELISLLKKVAPYMKKEKTIGDPDIINYINMQIDKFQEKENFEYQTDIATILGGVDSMHGLQYLENKLGDFETDKNKTLDHFDSLIQLSDFYFDLKDGDKAFETMQRATQLVTNFNDQFDYLWKQKIIAEKCANICLNGQKPPQYANYLHYEIVAFILEIARDIIHFPHLSEFFHRKNICFNDGWGFEENKGFNKALEHLNISNYEKELVKDIYNFAFEELPLKMGIPKKYLNEKVLEPLTNLSSDFDENYPKWQKIMDFMDEFKKKPFNIALPHDFAGNIVKKYYDKENK